MNYLKPSGFILAITLLFSAGISAQSTAPINEPNLNKPRLFDNLPAEIPLNTADLKVLFTSGMETGKDVNLRLSVDNKIAAFKGTIVSAADKYQHTMKSIVIRSSNYNGAAFTLSSTVQQDGSIAFSGRILSFQHGDVYELQKKNNQYVLVKRNFYELVNE